MSKNTAVGCACSVLQLITLDVIYSNVQIVIVNNVFKKFQKGVLMGAYRLKICRNKAGMTQEQVANYLGIKRPAYVHIETGRNELSTQHLLKLSELYGCSTDEILGSKSYYESLN